MLMKLEAERRKSWVWQKWTAVWGQRAAGRVVG
jgi:hypothetical protein